MNLFQPDEPLYGVRGWRPRRAETFFGSTGMEYMWPEPEITPVHLGGWSRLPLGAKPTAARRSLAWSSSGVACSRRRCSRVQGCGSVLSTHVCSPSSGLISALGRPTSSGLPQVDRRYLLSYAAEHGRAPPHSVFGDSTTAQ